MKKSTGVFVGVVPLLPRRLLRAWLSDPRRLVEKSAHGGPPRCSPRGSRSPAAQTTKHAMCMGSAALLTTLRVAASPLFDAVDARSEGGSHDVEVGRCSVGL